MTRILSSTVAAAALAGLVGLSAQTPPQSSEREQRAPKAKTVTVTGCLDQAPAPGSGDRPSSRDSMASPGGHFVLKNAQGGTSTVYMLMPAQGVDLAKHVNHKVEVSGTLAKSTTESSTPSSPPPPPPSATTPSATSSDRGGDPPMLTVKSVKMIANSCTT